MERIFAATDDGYYWLPKEATGNPLLNKKIEAMIPSVKSDAAGSHHEEITGDPLIEHRVGNKQAIYTGPERRKNLKQRDEWDRRAMYDVSINRLKEYLRESIDPAEKLELQTEIDRLLEMQRAGLKGAAVGALPVVEAREVMKDDSGATTGLRSRPDYGESDSLTSTLNRGNAKGAAAQYAVALAAHSKKEASKKATMYVTGIDWSAGDCLKIARFTFGPDPVKALKLGSITATAVSRQLNSPKFKVKSRVVIATA